MPSTLPDYSDSVYTSYYCEENIYLLLKRFLTPSGGTHQWDAFAVFISNPTRTVALWNQRIASSRCSPVIWDYHVVLALRERPQLRDQSLSSSRTSDERDTWIYDLDTHVPVPCRWKEYVDQTFPLGSGAPAQYQRYREIQRSPLFMSVSNSPSVISLFRVVPGEVYLDNFASDRSHMVFRSDASEEPRYLAVPPSYPVICGPVAERNGVNHNLMTHFVSMIGGEGGFGTVMDFDAFTMWCSPRKS